MTTKNRFTFFNVKKSFFKHLTKTIIPCIAYGIIISESFYPAWFNSSNTGVGVHLDTVLIKKKLSMESTCFFVHSKLKTRLNKPDCKTPVFEEDPVLRKP